uniref:C2H2-type domain-containing protein n=1 Tax=Gasterosteus aculeatus TaxID=69293 RepID=G3N875_GASAC
SGVKPHRCDLCPKAYMRTNDLEHHKKVAHVRGAAESTPPSSLLCDLCGKEFKCRSQLAVHFQTHTGERPHLCDICGRKFGRQYQLKRHKALVHAKQSEGDEAPPPDGVLACSVCGKRLKSEALLAAHARIHSGNKPHRCGICLRAFQRATCLKQHHLRIHDDRPYGCDFCSRSFRRLSHLKRHREVVHANGERPPQTFVCHICGKDKKCRSQLARHVIIHSGERPFACDLCAARFNRSGNLQQHRKRMH